MKTRAFEDKLLKAATWGRTLQKAQFCLWRMRTGNSPKSEDLYRFYLTLTWPCLLALLQYGVKNTHAPGKIFLSPLLFISRWLLTDSGYFMHFNTSAGAEGSTAILESRILYPKRGFQCLQFYYYNSGHESDHLYVWVREYTSAHPNGTLRLVGEIKGME